MRQGLIYFRDKQLKRHKLFYTLTFVLVVFTIYIFKSTWFVNGLIKYCNIATLRLSSFNSIFELCATFNLAYTVILRFRHGIKNRVYNDVHKRLEYVIQKTNLILVTSPRYNRHIEDLVEYLNDIVNRKDIELRYSESKFEHRGEDSFLYFAFYSLLCLIISALIDGVLSPDMLSSSSSSSRFTIEAFSFLLLFSISSLILVDLRYIFFKLKKPNFEKMAIIFVLNLIVCFSIVRVININNLLQLTTFGLEKSGSSVLEPVFEYFSNAIKYFYEPANLKGVVNYIIILCIFINVYPYFQVFRGLYFISMQYSCTSYQIHFVVDAKIRLKEISFRFGKSIISFSNRLRQIGEDIQSK